jgi:alpha-tubulin suppressor-like RCC1 family protein
MTNFDTASLLTLMSKCTVVRASRTATLQNSSAQNGLGIKMHDIKVSLDHNVTRSGNFGIEYGPFAVQLINSLSCCIELKMFAATPLRRTAPRAQNFIRSCRRHVSNKSSKDSSELSWTHILAAGSAGAAAYWGFKAVRSPPVDAEAPRTDTGPIFELQRPKTASKEENRDSISSQHVQTKKSWDNPGVYAWGLNTGRVVAPDSEERWIKSPRRIPFFDGILLRDIKLDKNFGAAINEKGDLLQWGVGYSTDTKEPEPTLTGRNLRSLAISDDRIIALAESGSVYSIPVSKEKQAADPKLKESSWFWSSGTTNIGCRSVTPENLGYGEKVVSIAGGLEHVLMLTSRGRVFSAASSSSDFPKHGQLGIPGLTWYSRPPGRFDQPHEITALRGAKIEQIAAGDTHSLVLDSEGRAFSFGDNAQGQLGIPYNPETMDLDSPLNISTNVVDIPTQVPIKSLYDDVALSFKVRGIGAGGFNSYFMIESQPRDDLLSLQRNFRGPSSSADVLACGRGIWGALGNGKLTHIQWTPTKIPALSGMIEFNEETGKQQPIRVGSFQVGETHVAAVMANITRVGANSSTSANDTNWGSDVYFFGHNENFQLGTGRRANQSIPTHILPLGMNTSKLLPGQEFDRFQLTPAKKITFAGRSVWVEQRVECGRQCSAVYSAAL